MVAARRAAAVADDCPASRPASGPHSAGGLVITHGRAPRLDAGRDLYAKWPAEWCRRVGDVREDCFQVAILT
jgi:hypothetical protein